MFKIKKGYYLEFLTPETTKLLKKTTSKITKHKNDENNPYLENTEVVLKDYNVVINSYQQNSRDDTFLHLLYILHFPIIHSFPINNSVSY